jgi:membrane protease YdiL (CAAX protease family)
MLIASVSAYGALTGWDHQSLGLTFRPIQGYLFWVKATAVFGGGVIGFVLVARETAALFGYEILVLPVEPSVLWLRAWDMSVTFPVLEEGIYRFVLCFAMVRLVGPSGTILVSGCLFAGLHVLYGYPAPSNVIAGFVLAWAYLASGTILIPVVWHVAGNVLAMFAQAALWHYTPVLG